MTHLVLVALRILQAAGSSHESHSSLDSRGAMVMGFDQEKTTHHFLLYRDGGAIDVSANEDSDVKSRDAIRSHLPHIAQMFGEGNFAAPMLVHASDVPGTAELAKRKDRVQYKYVETRRGGRVDIVTTDETALRALHEFLRFQIRDHETGDTTEVGKR
jgi:hypothetical protein